MWPLYFKNPITKHTKEIINLESIRSDAWLLNIKKLVKLTVFPSKTAVRYMAPENPME